jgi:hypothetical protein
MATAVKKPALDDVKLGALLLQKKLITEAHLRTAIDYQRSLGGRLIDVLCELNILRPAQVEQISSLLGKDEESPAKPHRERHLEEESPSDASPSSEEETGEDDSDESALQERGPVERRVEGSDDDESGTEKAQDGNRRETTRDEPTLEDTAGEETRRVEKGRDASVLSPDSVKPSDLKVHWRLLDKLPKSTVEEYLLLLFFPTGGVPSRKIILGHGQEIDPEVRDKVRSTIGVDVVTLSLSPEVAKAFLSGSRHVAGDMANKSVRIVKTPQPPPQGRKDEGGLLLALVSLLSRKGVITLEELEEEFGRCRTSDKSEK